MLALTALIFISLGLISAKPFPGVSLAALAVSMAAALAVAIVVWFFARCFSSWRNFKRFLLGLGCVAILIALAYAVEDVRGKVAWGRFKAKWESKGEKFDLRAFIPPPVPEDQNFAMTPVVASSYRWLLDRNGHRLQVPDTNVVKRLEMPLAVAGHDPTNGAGNWQKAIPTDLAPWQRYYRQLALTTNLFPVGPPGATPAADVLLALSRYDSTIEELRHAAELPGSRFPLNYDSEEPYAILLPHLAPMKGCVVVLKLRAIAEIQAGQSQKGLADVLLALRLTDKIRSEPILISHLVRIAMVQIAMQTIWEGLGKHCWTDAEIAQLDRQLAAMDFIADIENGDWVWRYPGDVPRKVSAPALANKGRFDALK